MDLGAVLMKIATALFIVLGTVAFIGQYIFTQILVKIALMVMPIMVPFIMLEKTKFIFEGWLKFLITAGFTKIIGATLFGIMLGNVDHAMNIALQAADQKNGSVVAFYVYSTLLLVTGLMIFIMMQTQQIGNALVSGFVQGGFRFSPMHHANQASKGAADAGRRGVTFLDRSGGAVTGGTAGAYRGAKSGGGTTAAMQQAKAGAAAGIQKGISGQIKEAMGFKKVNSQTTSGTTTQGSGIRQKMAAPTGKP